MSNDFGLSGFYDGMKAGASFHDTSEDNALALAKARIDLMNAEQQQANAELVQDDYLMNAKAQFMNNTASNFADLDSTLRTHDDIVKATNAQNQYSTNRWNNLNFAEGVTASANEKTRDKQVQTAINNYNEALASSKNKLYDTQTENFINPWVRDTAINKAEFTANDTGFTLKQQPTTQETTAQNNQNALQQAQTNGVIGKTDAIGADTSYAKAQVARLTQGLTPTQTLVKLRELANTGSPDIASYASSLLNANEAYAVTRFGTPKTLFEYNGYKVETDTNGSITKVNGYAVTPEQVAQMYSDLRNDGPAELTKFQEIQLQAEIDARQSAYDKYVELVGKGELNPDSPEGRELASLAGLGLSVDQQVLGQMALIATKEGLDKEWLFSKNGVIYRAGDANKTPMTKQEVIDYVKKMQENAIKPKSSLEMIGDWWQRNNQVSPSISTNREGVVIRTNPFNTTTHLPQKGETRTGVNPWTGKEYTITY